MRFKDWRQEEKENKKEAQEREKGRNLTVSADRKVVISVQSV